MRRIIFHSLFIFCVINSFAQQSQQEHISQQITIGTALNAEGNLAFPFDNYAMNKRIIKGVAVIKLDMGEEHVSDPNISFTGKIQVTLKTLKDGGVVNELNQTTVTLRVNQDQPESYHTIDLLSFKEVVFGNENLSFDELQITVSNSTLPPGFYGSAMRLTAYSEVDLGIAVNGLKSNVAKVEVNDQILVSDKVANFKWKDHYPITNYQIQVLRLHNSDEETVNTEQIIQAKVDWTKAMSFDGQAAVDINDHTKFFTLTLAEGTGFYAYRVRPIGAYHAGGIADQRNWGKWSDHDPQNTVKNLNINTVTLPYFYFTDPDENRNWIYNRVFAENNKIKENMNFANGLQQPRQSQTYLPSQGVTLVMQTILDHSGRPTVTTIPIPLGGRVSKYEEGLVTSSGTDELYQAKHFDDEGNFNDPVATVPFSYYDNNADKSIPNDNGYGFSRTIFYNESANRILKQSGVGETHKIGSGKTTRYLYSTASEEELIALFGDEAPDSESVIKTITIDPNDIASIAYTSKEGNVIATSLAFYQQNTSLMALDEPINVTTVQDEITKNSKIPGGFVSSKRISLLQDNPNFQVSYSIACYTFEQLCQVATVDCDYQLVINLIKLDDNGNMENKQVLISESLTPIPCQDIDGQAYKIIDPVSIDLAAGSYIIEKRLVAGDAALSIAENTENINKQVYPITDLVSGWLGSIEDVGMLDGFNKSLYNLSQAIENQTLDQFTNAALNSTFPVDIPQPFFDEVYDTYKDQYFLTFQPESYDPYGANVGENPIAFTLGTPCCIINIPVKWIPPFDCTPAPVTDADNNGKYDVINLLDLADKQNPVEQEYFPDFEGYALAFMSDCVGPSLDFTDQQLLEKAIYATYMEGWEIKGTFNMMVYHMLNDVYSTNNTADEAPVNEVQYDCDQLLACWTGQLSRLKNEICAKFNFYQDDSKTNVSNEFDEQHGDDPNQTESDHDSHFDDNFEGGNFLIKWIAKRKISKRMRDLESGQEAIAPEYGHFHLVKEFLECTGYQFAKIITPFDAEPLAQDIDAVFQPDNNNPAYAIPIVNPNVNISPLLVQINHTVTKNNYFIVNLNPGDNDFPSNLLANGGYAYGYIPLNDWNPQKKIKSQAAIDAEEANQPMLPTDLGYFTDSGESLFPNIKNPIYAFKYFEYPSEGNSDYQTLEVSVCYSDPNDCYQLDNNDFIELDNDGVPIKVPCCSDNPAWNADGCYADTEYPGLNPNMVGYGTDVQNNPAKYIVTDFCEQGRAVCPYTKDVWSSGQRFTFYSMIKNYVVPPVESEWNTVPNFDLTCDDLNSDHQWYVYTGPLQVQEDQGYADLVNETIYDNNTLIQYYTQLTLEDGQTTTFKYIRLEIESQLQNCNNGCDNRRTEFRNKLLDMLQSKCYEIGGCRTDDPATHHIIPEGDIELMLDGMIEACKSQCNLTTFSCQATPCRSINMPFTTIGFDETNFDVKYGIGGFDPAFCEDSNYSYDDDIHCTDPDNDGIYDCERLDPVTGTANSLSWYEYTRMKQAIEWDFDVDMPTKCFDENNNPISTGSDIDCESCVPPGPNTYAGDPFVPKEEYEVNTNIAPNSNAPEIGDQVVTPAIGINIKVDQ